MNEGKRFESDFRASIPSDVYYLRIPDSAVGFDVEHSTQRFSIKSPYDVILCKKGRMYAIELKSTKEKSVSFAGSNPKIKDWQIKELIKVEYYGGVAGIIINFRSVTETYFVPIWFVDYYIHSTERKSIGIADVRKAGVLLPARKLKVNYRYDLSPLLG